MDTAALARNTDPQTSHDAATDVQERVARMEVLVLRSLYDHPAGLNWDEITNITGMRAGSVSPRFAPLRQKKLIQHGRCTRKGSSGSVQTVWTITDRGRWLIDKLSVSGRLPEYLPRADKGPRALIVKGPIDLEGMKGLYPGRIIQAQAEGITAADIDAITDAQWYKILDGQKNMKGWCRKRFKRAIRLLVEGRIYDDPDEDGRKKV